MLKYFMMHEVVVMVVMKIRGRSEHSQSRHRRVCRHRVVWQPTDAFLSLDLCRDVGKFFRH